MTVIAAMCSIVHVIRNNEYFILTCEHTNEHVILKTTAYKLSDIVIRLCLRPRTWRLFYIVHEDKEITITLLNTQVKCSILLYNVDNRAF